MNQQKVPQLDITSNEVDETQSEYQPQQVALPRYPNSTEKSQNNIFSAANTKMNKSNNLNITQSESGTERVPLYNNINRISVPRNQTPQNQRQVNSLVKSFRLLTYNIFLRPPPIKNNKDDYKNERTKLFLNSIAEFDIICLQELFGFLNQRKHKIIFNGMKQGYFYHATSPSPSFFSSYLVDGGLVTISRFPIVEKVYKPYKYGVLSDNLSQKGVLYTKIQINDAYLHLFNSHLQASYVGAENNVKATVITRIDQLLLMRQFIEECVRKYRENDSDVIMICGDYNVNARPHSYPMHYLNDMPDIQNQMKTINPKEFSEYDILTHVLSNGGKDELVDTLREKFKGESPITYSDTYIDKDTNQEFPLEEALTIKEDLLQKSCLDYIMQLKLPIMSKEEIDNHQIKEQDDDEDIECRKLRKSVYSYNRFKVDYEQVCVEKFFVSGQPFTQLSDHYGVSASLRYTMADEQHNNKLSALEFKSSVISSKGNNKLNLSQNNNNNQSMNHNHVSVNESS